MLDRRSVLASSLSAALAGSADEASNLVDDVARRTFRYFWETTDADTGLAPDRWPTPSFASIAAVGFALTSYPVGVASGWIGRAQARTRTLRTLSRLADAPQGPEAQGRAGHRGFFYHFLHMNSGLRFGGSELSTIDTALLLAGVLAVQSAFDADHPQERRIRELAERIYRAVDWPWALARPPLVSMGWRPESGFIASDWSVYNESLILYVLALGSPTHPLAPETWDVWTRGFEASWRTGGRAPHLDFPPLFGHQYSHCWIDFRGVCDRYIASKGLDYFENSRRATYAQRDYAMANPGGFADYGPDIWGLTACDGPGDFRLDLGGRAREFYSYSARGPGDRDDGTLAPTAALGSIAFAPEIVLPAARAMHARYGRAIYGRYGFLDSFNPTLTRVDAPLTAGRIAPGMGWVDTDHLGIDQGPILLMAENRRSGLIWRLMGRNPHIRRGLKRAGFTGGWLDA